MDPDSPQSDERSNTNLIAQTGERVVVRCPGFTCLAYRDAKGTWRADKDAAELPEILEVVFRF